MKNLRFGRVFRIGRSACLIHLGDLCICNYAVNTFNLASLYVNACVFPRDLFPEIFPAGMLRPLGKL